MEAPAPCADVEAAGPFMKNFIRLVKFAWPYRLRFGLSLGCAMMVAVLWFLNISAVYPLLQILFYHQNCQRWIGEQIAESETRIACLEARIAEVEAVEVVVELPRDQGVVTLRER